MKMGIIKIIGAMMAGMMGQPGVKGPNRMNVHELATHKSNLLLNGYAGPVPHRINNQRQRRKQWRHSPNARPKSNRK